MESRQMNTNSKVVFAGKLALPKKPKSIFSELVRDEPRGLSEKEFNAKLDKFREDRKHARRFI